MPTVVPDAVDLRSKLWPVEDVGGTLASAASAAAAALSEFGYRVGLTRVKLSPFFIHYNARAINNQQDKVVGTTMKAVMQAVSTYGVCPDVSWPIDLNKIAEKPPADAYDAAKPFIGFGFHEVADPFEALAMGYPLPFVAQIPMRCLQGLGRDGRLPELTDADRAGLNTQPWFAMLLVGYDKAAKAFIVRDSGGLAWGDHGHCRMSFETFDTLVLRQKERIWYVWKAVAIPVRGTAPDRPAGPGAPTSSPEAPPAGLSSLTAGLQNDIRSRLEADVQASKAKIRDRFR